MQASPSTTPSEPGAVVSMADAAAILNLPPTLLESFVSYKFNEQKLECLDRKRGTFLRQDVEAYAGHLDSRWPDTKRDIPEFVKRYVDVEAEASGGCASCRQKSSDYDYAHIKPWEKSRCHSPHNIVRLCPTCHRSHGADVPRLTMVKDLARRRLWAVAIGHALARRDRWRMALLSVLVGAALVLGVAATYSWSKQREFNQRQDEVNALTSELAAKTEKLIAIEKQRLPRRVDEANLARKLSALQPGGVRITVDMASGAEGGSLASQLLRSFQQAGFDVDHGVAVAPLTPPLYKIEIAVPQDVRDVRQAPERVLRIASAIAAEGVDVDLGRTEHYSDDLVLIRVGSQPLGR